MTVLGATSAPRPGLRARHPLVWYVGRRLAQAVPLVFAVLVINFALIHLAPGDPVQMFIPEFGVDPELANKIRRDLGLDRSVFEQFVIYISGAMRLDLGDSLRYRQPVVDLVLDRAPATLLLTGTGFVLSSVLGILIGTLAASRGGHRTDRVASLAALAAFSMPAFWLAQILLLVFALNLGWFPSQGMISSRPPPDQIGRALDVAHHMVLPVFAYSLFPLALIFRLTRSKMIETLESDFVQNARAKGLPERRVLLSHALPNAFLPTLTVLGTQFAFLLAGSVLIETVFAWPGIGRLLSEATLARDFPVVLGLFMITSVMVIIAALVVDILYAVLDPRVADSQFA